MQHIHILGICGTFMGGLAILARQNGYRVSGSDTNVYPPMSTQLEQQGIELMEGYQAKHLQPSPDWVIVGNALSRGNPAVEYILDQGLAYTSGPQWLYEHLLRNRWVLAVAGTHGKTTTASMLAWILEYAGLKPGFLIGGVAENFSISARSGDEPFFVVEADEYDSAFFDKRSKFVHYHPRTLVINNLEFDHADIFANLQAIQTQFHHLVRTVPASGLIIAPHNHQNVQQTLDRGCWTPIETFGEFSSNADWQVEAVKADGSRFNVHHGLDCIGQVNWELSGQHNMHNALTAVAAARHSGVIAEQAVVALNQFRGVKRRMELKGSPGNINIYDDFAHHPTAIATTLAGLRARYPNVKIIAVFEPRSHTMRMGVHKEHLAESFILADVVLWYKPDAMDWDLEASVTGTKNKIQIYTEHAAIVAKLAQCARAGDQIVVMSNGGFGGIHAQILETLTRKHKVAS